MDFESRQALATETLDYKDTLLAEPIKLIYAAYKGLENGCGRGKKTSLKTAFLIGSAS